MKYTLTFMLIFFCIIVSAQEEFAPVGAKWTVNYHSFINCNVYPQYFLPKVMECTGTEMVQGQLCKRLEGDFACSYFGFTQAAIYIYQEDGKVYVYNPETSDFHILYNFDAGVGESWTVSGLPYYSSPGYDEIIVTVTSVEEIMLEGDILKMQTVEFDIPDNPGYEPEWAPTFIEKIGNTDEFFPRHGLCDAPYLSLRCYQDNDDNYIFDAPVGLCGVGTTIEQSYACSDTITVLLNSNADIGDKNILLFPSPFSTTVHLLLPPGIASKDCLIRISDTAGRILIKQDTKGKEEVILSTQDLPSGMYLVSVEAEGYRGVEKVVKIN